MSTPGGIFHPALRVYQIWGTRQGVGKTVFSTAVCFGAFRVRRAKGVRDHVGFLKPVTTGRYEEAEHVRIRYSFHKMLGPKSLPAYFQSTALFHQQKLDETASPATAVVSNKALLDGVRGYAAEKAEGLMPPGGWLFVETLGGVESLLPSGSCQADVYRPLQLPAILIADTKPGGHEETLKAFESLRRRNYDVQYVVAFKESSPEPHLRLAEHFDKLSIPFHAMRQVPEFDKDERKNKNIMKNYYASMARSNAMKELLANLYARHNQRAKAEPGQLLEQTLSGLDDIEPGVVTTVWDRPLDFSYKNPGKNKRTF